VDFFIQRATQGEYWQRDTLWRSNLFRKLRRAEGRGALGDHVFSLLEGTTGRMSFLVPGRQARRWMCVAGRGRRADAEKIASRLRMNPEFAGKVYEMIAPGTTVINTDQPVVRSRRNAAILER
jgi:hypothetical protein